MEVCYKTVIQHHQVGLEDEAQTAMLHNLVCHFEKCERCRLGLGAGNYCHGVCSEHDYGSIFENDQESRKPLGFLQTRTGSPPL